ncbi:hypothetical protein PACTADRAFT_47852 [Pachysolen tannophilus NRRL Y-2460]|uniref:J domain-containing protein n=1 Tax=Pachysolen tannophilus NRRL Y-2460 TaxID=669874 RepID=A0A1E4U217_PACTA|nr:hypothetical protein PACTADRAFT_47852 [Pachysolen tannophilus NRRL Y-2460]
MSSEKSYTKEQETIVLKLLSIDKTDYYKILDIQKTATDSEIKKSYRKLAIKLHPDKNNHPKSSEAFKKLAKAFEVLNDPDKKRIFDQTGSDPDSRGMGTGSSSGFADSPFASGGTQFPFQRNPFGSGASMGGASPFGMEDDLLNFLFNGGGNSFAFGNGNGFTFHFGGPAGYNSYAQQQRQRQRERQQQQQQQQRQRTEPQTPLQALKENFRQFFPLILFLLIPLISNLLAGNDDLHSKSTLPKFSFEPQPSLPVERVTSRFHIPYYINEKTFTDYGGYEDKNKKENNKNNAKLSLLDKKIENVYINDLKVKCNREENYKNRAIEDSYGILFVNKEKLKKAEAIELPSCTRLQDLGLL